MQTNRLSYQNTPHALAARLLRVLAFLAVLFSLPELKAETFENSAIDFAPCLSLSDAANDYALATNNTITNFPGETLVDIHTIFYHVFKRNDFYIIQQLIKENKLTEEMIAELLLYAVDVDRHDVTNYLTVQPYIRRCISHQIIYDFAREKNIKVLKMLQSRGVIAHHRFLFAIIDELNATQNSQEQAELRATFNILLACGSNRYATRDNQTVFMSAVDLAKERNDTSLLNMFIKNYNFSRYESDIKAVYYVFRDNQFEMFEYFLKKINFAKEEAIKSRLDKFVAHLSVKYAYPFDDEVYQFVQKLYASPNAKAFLAELAKIDKDTVSLLKKFTNPDWRYLFWIKPFFEGFIYKLLTSLPLYMFVGYQLSRYMTNKNQKSNEDEKKAVKADTNKDKALKTTKKIKPSRFKAVTNYAYVSFESASARIKMMLSNPFRVRATAPVANIKIVEKVPASATQLQSKVNVVRTKKRSDKKLKQTTSQKQVYKPIPKAKRRAESVEITMSFNIFDLDAVHAVIAECEAKKEALKINKQKAKAINSSPVTTEITSQQQFISPKRAASPKPIVTTPKKEVAEKVKTTQKKANSTRSEIKSYISFVSAVTKEMHAVAKFPKLKEPQTIAFMQEAKKILLFLINSSFENANRTFFAGGFVRDLLLNKIPKDIDIVTAIHPKDLEKLFKVLLMNGINARNLKIGKHLIIHNGNHSIDIWYSEALANKAHANPMDAVAADYNNRDIKCNGCLADIADNVYDGSENQEAYQNIMKNSEGDIEAIGDADQTRHDNPVRMLRDVYYSIQLQRKISLSLHIAIERQQHRLRDTMNKLVDDSYELDVYIKSVCAVLKKIFLSDHSKIIINKLAQYRILETLFSPTVAKYIYIESARDSDLINKAKEFSKTENARFSVQRLIMSFYVAAALESIDVGNLKQEAVIALPDSNEKLQFINNYIATLTTRVNTLLTEECKGVELQSSFVGMWNDDDLRMYYGARIGFQTIQALLSQKKRLERFGYIAEIQSGQEDVLLSRRYAALGRASQNASPISFDITNPNRLYSLPGSTTPEAVSHRAEFRLES